MFRWARRDLTGNFPGIAWWFAASLLALLVLAGFPAKTRAEPLLDRYLELAQPSELVPGADSYGPVRGDLPVAPALKDGKPVGWVFLTSDFVPTAGYSGKPIHILAGVSDEAVITGVRLVKHSEPIVLVGIPEARIREVTEKYAGLDLRKEASSEKEEHELDIVSGATVTIMIIDDSIVRAGIKVAKALSLGGLTPDTETVAARRSVDRGVDAVEDWQTLTGDGSVRHFTLDVETINADFAALGDPRAGAHTEPGPDSDAYIDVWTALVSQPAIGRSLLGDAEYANLKALLKDGDEAILVAGRGRWSFKGSGYVRGGIFDRIQVIQGDISHRFRDREHRRVARLAAAGAPDMTETDVFIIPQKAGFDAAASWRLQMLVQRPVGAIDKLFLNYDLGYDLPDRFLVAQEAPAVAAPAARPSAEESAVAIRDALWLRIWDAKRNEVVILGLGLAFLTGIFFFQTIATRNERVFNIIRTAFLVFTLVFIGWYANAQLSVVNVLAVFSALVSDFRWETFLMDPLIFVMWFAVAAALLFWARGAYCGWLCPFGALQELSNKIARLLRVPQVTLPWGLHERLWPVKYVIFLGLFGMSLYSLEMAEHYAEIEPFKTAIILKFDRPWPYVLFALAMLAPGLFIERFYCRYVCPLGGGLAIPARLHMFRWLKRYKECGNPCQVCAHDCPVQAIHPTGEINPNECISCLNCQVLYQHTAKCPVVVAKIKKRERFEKQNGLAPSGSGQPPVNYKPKANAPAASNL
ncbi:4Fe-4S binding protein [Nitratireductor indicus]|uniref:4Fe-4S binding protein n=1 Tax=Nitratireductor indicus TaxID=721133 RepID=UPI00287656A4|nr:4Fe-4S binding protein [Nitratireductor indicus]MDS1136400.1 4Fe-4S binding protein [Nitratireductor indicus]